MNSCFVGYLLKVVTFCCYRCLYFKEQTEYFENFAALLVVPRSCYSLKELEYFITISCFYVKLTVLRTSYSF